jgi:hypothetical protein
MFVEEHCTEHNVRVHATMLCVFQKWHISEDGEMIQMKSDANPNSIDAKVVHEIAHSALNNHHLPPGVQKKTLNVNGKRPLLLHDSCIEGK